MEVLIVRIIGIIITISISKIKKITAIMKKWIENGNRVYDMGLNPHSNGVAFWLSIITFFLTNTMIIMTITRIRQITIIDFNINIIIHFNEWPLKLEALYTLYTKWISIYLISIPRYIGTITLRPQSVSIMLRFQILHDVYKIYVVWTLELLKL